MRKILSVAALLVLALTLVGTASAGKVGFMKTWVYDPGNLGTASAAWTKEGLSLQKNAPTSAWLAAGAEIKGVQGESLDQLSFDVKGYCGAGAPRFNVLTGTDSLLYFGCAHGAKTALGDGWTRVVFNGSEAGGGAFGATIASIDVVQDEEGQTLLRNISVNGVEVNKFPNS
jgi:hypothetical protein